MRSDNIAIAVGRVPLTTKLTLRSPIVPGHEIIGHVAGVGEGVSEWKVGDRVGGAWHGGHDGESENLLHISPMGKKEGLTPTQALATHARRVCSRCATTASSTAKRRAVDVGPFFF